MQWKGICLCCYQVLRSKILFQKNEDRKPMGLRLDEHKSSLNQQLIVWLRDHFYSLGELTPTYQFLILAFQVNKMSLIIVLMNLWIIPQTDFSVLPWDSTIWAKGVKYFLLPLKIKISNSNKIIWLGVIFLLYFLFKISSLISYITYTPIHSLFLSIPLQMLYSLTHHHNPALNFSAPFAFLHYCYFLCLISMSYLELI